MMFARSWEFPKNSVRIPKMNDFRCKTLMSGYFEHYVDGKQRKNVCRGTEYDDALPNLAQPIFGACGRAWAGWITPIGPDYPEADKCTLAMVNLRAGQLPPDH